MKVVAFQNATFTHAVRRGYPKVQLLTNSATPVNANFCLAFFMFLLFLLMAHRCPAQVPERLGAPKEQQAQRIREFIFGLSQKDSVSQSLTVDSFWQLTKKKGDERAGLYARLFLAEMLSRKEGQTKASSTVLLGQKDLFETTPFLDVTAIYYLLLAETFESLGKNEEMFHYIISATDLFDKIGWSYAPVGRLDYLFYVYYRYQDYPTAIRFVKIALNRPKPDTFGYDFRLNNLGETYLRMKDLTRAQATFQQVIQRARALGDTAYIGIASGNFGNTLRLQGKFRDALPYLYLDLELNETKVPENSAITCAYIANCLLHCDSLEKAGIYLQKAYGLQDGGNWHSFSHPYFEASALYWKKTGDYRKASLYQDSLMAIKDSIKERYNNSILFTTSITIKEERRLAELRQKALETARLQLIRDVVIGLLVLLFSAVLIILLRKRRMERERFALQQQQSEERLHNAEGELAQYISAIKEKNKLIGEIQARLQQGEESMAGSEEVTLQHLQHLSLLTEADWLKFKLLFSAVWPGFFDDLPNRYPGLSQGEVRLLALCKLELSSKEMAAMLGISQDSLRKSRYRLRKKYPQLMEDEDFKHVM